MIENYDKKARYLYDHQHGLCAISGEPLKRFWGEVQMHHKLADTKTNNKIAPLFINSVWNLCLVNTADHMTKPLPRVSDYEARKRQWFLQQHPMIAKWVNGEE
jgi:hypothetical protein